MNPKFEMYDYIIFLCAIPSFLCAFLPCIPALLVSCIKKYGIKNRIKFSVTSCIAAYGITTILILSIGMPFTLVNTYLVPRWAVMGNESLTSFFVSGASFFSQNLIIPVILVTSIVVPFRLANYWK